MLRWCLTILGTLLLAGCATIMTPGAFAVPVDSRPSGAAVIYEGRQVGMTPCLVAVRRGACRLELVHDGYHRQQVDLGEARNWWVAGNMVTMGLGMIVDVALGMDRQPCTEPALVWLHSSDGPYAPWMRLPLIEPPEERPIDGFGWLLVGVVAWATRTPISLPPAYR